MSDNGQGDCYQDIRCPKCRNVRAQACEGSNIRAQCRKCKFYFCGIIVDGEFKLKRVDHFSPSRQKPVVASVNPPTLTG